MKSYIAKSILILVMLGGTVSGLLIYNRALSILSVVIDLVGYSWISIIFLFMFGVFIARLVIGTLSKELVATTAFTEINLMKISKFFVGGFVGCYSAFSIVGPIAFVAYMVLRYFFLQ